jgi:hypothetical protein
VVSILAVLPDVMTALTVQLAPSVIDTAIRGARDQARLEVASWLGQQANPDHLALPVVVAGSLYQTHFVYDARATSIGTYVDPSAGCILETSERD